MVSLALGMEHTNVQDKKRFEFMSVCCSECVCVGVMLYGQPIWGPANSAQTASTVRTSL